MKKQYIHVNELDDIYNRLGFANNVLVCVHQALAEGPDNPEGHIDAVYGVSDYIHGLLKEMGEILGYEEGKA